VTAGDIGDIVVGSVLAIILLVLLLLWIYKGRRVWNQMRAKETPVTREGWSNTLSNLKEDIKDLKSRMEALEGGEARRSELESGQRAMSDASELYSPTSRERPRLPSIPARVEP
jgi:biopolymer transport protein ExbB/TolQ